MRETWILEILKFQESGVNVSVIFLVAIHSSDKAGLNAANNEADIHNDLLVLDLNDSYRMWSIKTISLLDYIIERCKKTVTNSPKIYRPVIGKINIDTVINPKLLASLLLELSEHEESEFCAGSVIQSAVVFRNATSRWFVPYTLYRKALYDDYPQGCIYFISFPAAERLVQLAYCLSAFLYIDDSVIPGVMREALSIPLRDFSQFYLLNNFNIFKDTETGRNVEAYRNIAFIHNDKQLTYQDYDKIWKYLRTNNSTF